MSSSNSSAIAIYPLTSTISVYNTTNLSTAFEDLNGTKGKYSQAYSFSFGSSSSSITAITYSNGYPYTGGFTTTINGNTFLIAPITATCSGPSGSTSNINSTSFAAGSTTPVGSYSSSYVGPSFVNSLGGNNGFNGIYQYISYFKLTPTTASSYSTSPLPTYYFVGVPTYSTSGNAVSFTYINSLGLYNPQTWTLFYQQSSNACNSSSGTCSTISANIGFPYYDNYYGPTFLYFQVIFAMPYWGGEKLSSYLYSSTTTANNNYLSPNIPGYVLAFYNRSYPLCGTSPYAPASTSECVLTSNPYSTYGTQNNSYGNYYPVIYEATNLVAQTNGTLPSNQTLLGFLNNTYGTAYSTLQDFLVEQGWLENVSSSGNSTNSAGSSTSGGVNFGVVPNYGDIGPINIDLGSGWWFAGYVPYNYVIGSSSQTWTTTTNNIKVSGKTVEFTSGNVVMATAVPFSPSTGLPNIYNPGSSSSSTKGTAIGNYFWDSITTTHS